MLVRKIFSRFHIATFIALLFHVSGCIGMFTVHRDWFIKYTPLNLLLMFALLVWAQPKKNKHFFLFVLVCFITGMIVEIIGVNTSLLFGRYEYGTVMGPKFMNVPWLIGINWFVILYTSAVVVTQLHNWIEEKYVTAGGMLSDQVKTISLVFDGALLATFFDYVMEPVAGKLGFWKWAGEGSIPFTNYLTWFVICTGLLYIFSKLSINKQNQFAVHLFIIQLLFFWALRTYL
jgi:putative membrane protein